MTLALSRDFGVVIAAAKVSTDSVAVLVIYLCAGLHWKQQAPRLLVAHLKEHWGARCVRVGWADVAGSEILAVL